MIEFGAKLSLKDGMLEALKKNVQLQKEFKERIEQSGNAVGNLGAMRATPVISAKDNATGIVKAVRNTVNDVSAMSANPSISVSDNATQELENLNTEVERLSHAKILTRAEVDDEASKKLEEINGKIKELATKVVAPVIRLRDLTSSALGKIKQRLKEIAVNYTPIVRLRDLATQGISKIKNTLGGLGSKAFTTVVRLKDNATSGINKIRVSLRTVQKMVATPLIKAKDTATKVITKVKSGLKSITKVFSPIVKLKDEASKIASKIKQRITEIKERHETKVSLKDSASAGIDAIKNGLKALAAGVVVTVAIKKVGDLAKSSLFEGAKLQQSTGGIKTLYGYTTDAAGNEINSAATDKMLEYANQAYKTTGLSANAYMENVTSFSASLLSAVSGDTNKAAEVANKAMIDMADNANKMGTDMESIQNAYQGFAKQNYTMLDNLKLGYGGTKEEMERLLSDAQKLTGTQYNIDNLADVYTAIGVIQDQLNITGTTAKEAEQTFSGSFASMKASAQNLLGNLSVGDGDAVARSMGELITTASTFFFGNFVPMLQNIFSNLPSAVSTAVSNVAPMIKENVLPLITSIKDTIFTGLSSIGIDTGLLQNVLDQLFNVNVDGGGLSGIFSSLKGMFVTTVNTILQILPPLISAVQEIAPVVLDIFSTVINAVGQIVPYVTPVIETIKNVIVTAMPVIQQIITTVANAIVAIMPTVSSIFQFVGNVIQQVLGVIGNHMGLFQTIVSTVVTVVSTVWQALAPVISAVVDVIITVVDGLLTGIEAVFDFLAPYIQTIWESICGFFDAASSTLTTIIDTLKAVFQGLFDAISTVFGGIQDTVSSVIDNVTGVISGAIDAISGFIGKIGDAVSAAKDFIGSGVDKVKGFFGFAYGKDRVPYDNYPAVLHQGEKVLTRNQADQYDRAMSTRGVQLTEIKPIDRGENNSGNIQTVPVATSGSAEKTVTQNITLEVNNPVITKEADVDKVVEYMVKRFEKLLPNMP